MIPVDRDGKPLRRAIVWLDNRSGEEARIIEGAFGIEKIYRTTGQPEVVPTWPATKILWMKRNEPQIFRQTHKFLLVEDYLLYKLTGKPIVTVGTSEAASLGVAMSAGVGVGMFPGLQQAVSRMVRISGRVEPNARNGEEYQEAYQCYLKLYEQLEPLF